MPRWPFPLRALPFSPPEGPSLDFLLTAAEPKAPLADRVAWAESLLAWVRRSDPAGRLRLLMQILDRQPENRTRVAQTLRSLLRETEALDLFTETGLPRAAGFFGEAANRLAQRFLPRSPASRDLGDIVRRLFPEPADAEWLESLDPGVVNRVAELWQHERGPDDLAWESLQTDLEDALILLASRIRVIGSAPEIRHRLSRAAFRDLPFQKLGPAVERLVDASRNGAAPAELAADLNYVRTLTDACDRALDDVTTHLEDAGVSTAVVYDLERLRALITRLELLLEAWGDPHLQATRAVVLLADLVREHHARGSVRALARENLQLLTRRLVERNAETGEHYFARTARDYQIMVRRALGGGAVMAFTTLVKFGVAALAAAPFIEGALAGLNYATSFVLIQLLGFTIATKQPANTAPALARRMNTLRDDRHVEQLVDEIVTLFRSQAAAVVGNLAAVAPLVALLDWSWFHLSGQHWLNSVKATGAIESLSPLSGTWLFAAFTGVLLWVSSLMAGWADNYFTLQQLRPALAENRTLRRWLGTRRTTALAGWLDQHVGALVGNISLGLLLGLVPKFLEFFGVPLDIRHVTLAAGQLAAALGSLGYGSLGTGPLVWIILSVLGIAVLNIAVSFTLALLVAMRARSVRAVERRTLYTALLRRFLREPWTFILPARPRALLVPPPPAGN